MSGKQGEGCMRGVNGGGLREGEYVGRSPGDELLTLTRCHSHMKPLRSGSLSVAGPQHKGIKWKISFFTVF